MSVNSARAPATRSTTTSRGCCTKSTSRRIVSRGRSPATRQNRPATSPPRSADSDSASATPPTSRSAAIAKTRSSVSEVVLVRSSQVAAASVSVTTVAWTTSASVPMKEPA